MTLLTEQKHVCRIDVQAAARTPGALRPLEEPEADPEGETICERQATQLVGVGDLEDLAVLDIGRVDVAAMQRGVHDGSFERKAVMDAEHRTSTEEAARSDAEERGATGSRKSGPARGDEP